MIGAEAPRGTAVRVRVRVLSVSHVLDFRGRALVAGVRPKFVAVLMLEGRDGVLENARSGVRVPTHEVVVFALDSVAKLFAERDVVGRTYEVDVRSYEVQGTPRFHLALA